MTRLSPLELSIARSVIYASLFDYPLTLEQLHETLLESGESRAAILAAWERSATLRQVIDYRDGFFFPAGRDALVGERARREALSHAFLHAHRALLRLICAMPYTRMVALSGSIAHLNLVPGGDLDVFIVTRGAHVWSVTVLVVLLAKLMRRRGTLCANFVMADTRLALDQQDLFTANQVIHLKPLVGGDLLPAFVAANPRVTGLYPNFRPRAGAPIVRPWVLQLKGLVERICGGPSRLVESVCRRAYAWHLRRRSGRWVSPEQVRLRTDYLKLHTRSHRRDVLDRYDEAMRAALACAERGEPLNLNRAS